MPPIIVVTEVSIPEALTVTDPTSVNVMLRYADPVGNFYDLLMASAEHLNSLHQADEVHIYMDFISIPRMQELMQWFHRDANQKLLARVSDPKVRNLTLRIFMRDPMARDDDEIFRDIMIP